MSTQKIKYTKGSGNIYKDLGFSDPEAQLAKARLAMRIEEIIAKRKLKQTEAAEILGLTQPKIPALVNGKFGGFSMEALIRFLNLLNQDVKIIVKTKSKRSSMHGHLEVAVA